MSTKPHFSLAVAHPTVWLCRPGMAANPCLKGVNTGGLDTTVAQLDGTVSVQTGKNAVVAQTLGPQWGLHLYDFNADQDDLVKRVSEEAAAWK